MVRTKPAAASSLANTGLKRLPTSKPTFSVKDIRAIIPAHCFKHSLVRSISYLVIDALIALALYTLSTYIDSSFSFLPAAPRLVVHSMLWVAYWICQGCVCTGLWVVGHECGHGGFYSNELVNDIFGWVVHSFLLVPYFSWKISHRRHHSNTNNLNRDEVFVPAFRSLPAPGKAQDETLLGTVKEQSEHSLVSVAQRWLQIAIMLLLGWPLYLFMNATGHDYKGKTSAFGLPPNHFFPSSPIFQPKEGVSILLSDLGLAIMGYLLYSFAQATSFVWLVKVYVVPYLIVNMWLVLITYLQHTHHAVPHYTEPRWEWLQGALCTVDRDYGILNHVFHHIGDTHVAHHLFHTMPHYHAEEATRAIKALLGDYYMSDSTPIATALFNTFSHEFNGGVKEAHDDRGAYWF